MNAIIAVVAGIPVLVGAVFAAAVAWLVRLKEKAHVRDEVTASAVRQAVELHGEGAAAEQAAVDELRRMSPRVRPKDPVGAVVDAVDRERMARASVMPGPQPQRPFPHPPPPPPRSPIDVRVPDEDGE